MPQSFALTGLEQVLSQLMRDTNVNALSCIHRVQQSVAAALNSQKEGARLARLSVADIVETLLVKASRVIAKDLAYGLLSQEPLREGFLEAHLQVALLGWLESHVVCPAELRALQGSRRALYKR